MRCFGSEAEDCEDSNNLVGSSGPLVVSKGDKGAAALSEMTTDAPEGKRGPGHRSGKGRWACRS